VITVLRSERIQRAARSRPYPLSRVWDWLVSRRNRAIAIERLSDHVLRDIGVHRRHRFRPDQQFR
jgi:uncharacterized protein YjiS (DUF1127 family)